MSDDAHDVRCDHHTTHDDQWSHPEWCQPALCSELGANLEHRGFPSMLCQPSVDGGEPERDASCLTWELRRLDVIRPGGSAEGGGQEPGEALVVMSIGQETVHIFGQQALETAWELMRSACSAMGLPMQPVQGLVSR